MRPRTEGEPRPGRSRIAPPKTWADAVRAFLDHHRTRRRSELTLKWYAADLRRFAEWFEGENGEEPALGAIDGEALLDFQGHLASRPIATRDRATKQVTKRKPKAATINRRLAAVRSLIAWAARSGYREEVRDPPPGLPEPPRVIKGLDPARQRKLLNEIERRGDHRARSVVLVLIHTGLRVRELCALTWSDFDLTRGRSAVKVAGKGGKPRVVELSRGGRAAFLDLRERIEADHGLDHAGPLDPVLVSARRDAAGGPVRLGTQGVEKMLKPYAAAVGVEKLTPYMLRHTFATNHTLAGDPLTLIQYWMGHGRLETTAISTRVGPEERRRAMDRFTLPEPDDD